MTNNEIFRLSHTPVLWISVVLLLIYVPKSDQIATCVCMNRSTYATFKASCNSNQIISIRKISLGQSIGGSQQCGSQGNDEVPFNGNDCFADENLNVRWRAQQNCNNPSNPTCSFNENFNENDFQSCNSWAQGYRYSCLEYDCVAATSIGGTPDTMIQMNSGATQTYNVGPKTQLRTPNYPYTTQNSNSKCSITIGEGFVTLVRIYDRRGRYLSGGGDQCPYQFYINSIQTYIPPQCSTNDYQYFETRINPVSGPQKIDVVFQQPNNGGNAEGAFWAIIETNSVSNRLECGSDISLLPIPGASTTTTSTTTSSTTTRTTTTTTTTTTTITTTSTTTTTTTTTSSTTTKSTTTTVTPRSSPPSTTTFPTTTTSTTKSSTTTIITQPTTFSRNTPSAPIIKTTTQFQSPTTPTQTNTALQSTSSSLHSKTTSGDISGNFTREPSDAQLTFAGKYTKPVAIGVAAILGGLILLSIACVLIYFCACASRDKSEKRPPTPPRSLSNGPENGSEGWDEAKIAHTEANNNTKITRANAKSVKAKAAEAIMSSGFERNSDVVPYHTQTSLEQGHSGQDVYEMIDDVSSAGGTLRNPPGLAAAAAPTVATIHEETQGTIASNQDNTYRRVRFQEKPELIKSPPGYIDEEEESNIDALPGRSGLKEDYMHSNLSTYTPKGGWDVADIGGPKWTGPSYGQTNKDDDDDDDGSKFNSGFSNISDDEKSERLQKASVGVAPALPQRDKISDAEITDGNSTTGSSKKGFKFGFGKSSLSSNKSSGKTTGSLTKKKKDDSAFLVDDAADEVDTDVMQNPLYGHHASMIF